MANIRHTWSFDGYEFPPEDCPAKGSSGDFNLEEKLVEHDPINADVTVLTSYGFRSRTRTISGTCGRVTRDTLRQKWQDGVVGTLIDAENRSIQARIIRATFETVQPDVLYRYTIEFMQR